MTETGGPEVIPVLSAAKLCTTLINIETCFDTGLTAARAHIQFCDHVFDDACLVRGATFIDSAGRDIDALVAQSLCAVQETGYAPIAMSLDIDEKRFILMQYAPWALLGGCVLQNIANVSTSHESISAHAHHIHSWHVGGGSYTDNHAVLYRQLLDSVDVNLPDLGSSRFSDNEQLQPIAWTLPAYCLSLSLFPHEYRAEILGAALFEMEVGIPALVVAAEVSGNEATYVESKYRQAIYSSDRNRIREELKAAIAEVIALGHAKPDTALRILKGFMISLALFKAWKDEVCRLIDDGYLAPTQAMVRLVRKKSKYAVGYHNRLKLANNDFDTLIAEDPECFVRELGASRWVSPGRPDASLLLTKLIAFGGPMFRVFSDTEIEIIRCWVRTLTKQTIDSMASTVNTNAISSHIITPPLHSKKLNHIRRRGKAVDTRNLYHRLINVEHYPEVRSEALDYANTWLARSANNAGKTCNTIPFNTYTHQQFRTWFEKKALAQAESYSPNIEPDGIGKTRDEVIDEALQLCPMIFIDGAWLQRWGNAGLVDSEIGALFYKIYSDEIGNGDTCLNHPNIYRNLMLQMDIHLPNFRTYEFAYFKRFTDAAFSIPVFWLSASQFPRRFFPETLGLNLAMELSGVGGSYRTARDELSLHSFSTHFVELHNTIDNASTGHSAMAVEAIELYMDAFLEACSPHLAAEQWRKVWTGFCALSIPNKNWRELFISPRYAT